jgi:hypothetical protein
MWRAFTNEGKVMKLLSKESIIFYSILGAFTAFFIAPFIRSLINFDWRIEILITTSIIIPIYVLAKRYLLSKFVKKD